MITGIHALIYAHDAAKARAFFGDTLGWPSVDAGRGWLIFAAPPAEIAAHPVHPGDEAGRCELYFMCDDVEKTLADLRRRGIEPVRPVSDQGWGLVTAISVPGAGEVGLYQPRHPIAAGMPIGSARKSGRRAPVAKASARSRPARSTARRKPATTRSGRKPRR